MIDANTSCIVLFQCPSRCHARHLTYSICQHNIHYMRPRKGRTSSIIWMIEQTYIDNNYIPNRAWWTVGQNDLFFLNLLNDILLHLRIENYFLQKYEWILVEPPLPWYHYRWVWKQKWYRLDLVSPIWPYEPLCMS